MSENHEIDMIEEVEILPIDTEYQVLDEDFDLFEPMDVVYLVDNTGQLRTHLEQGYGY